MTTAACRMQSPIRARRLYTTAKALLLIAPPRYALFSFMDDTFVLAVNGFAPSAAAMAAAAAAAIHARSWGRGACVRVACRYFVRS